MGNGDADGVRRRPRRLGDGDHAGGGQAHSGSRYGLIGDELVFDRTFDRAMNAVVLPAGWALANSTTPGTVSQIADGRVRLDFINPAPGEIHVVITARRAGVR